MSLKSDGWLTPAHYAAADRVIAYHQRRLQQIALLVNGLRYAYGGDRECWRGRPYPMDN